MKYIDKKKNDPTLKGFAHSPEVDLKCGNSFLGMIEGSFEHPQMSSMSINDLLFFILSGEGWCVSKRWLETASHGSAWIPTPSVPPATGSKLPGTIGRRPCHPLRPNDYSLELFHVPRRPPSNRSPRLTRNQNGGGSIHRSPFDGPPMDPYRAGLSRRRTDGEDRNRTYKSALGSCPYL